MTGYLPSAILNGFIYLVPYGMLSMASLEGYVSKSKKEIKTCSMVFYFLVGNVFFLSLLSGSLLDQIGESFTHPKDFPSHLASAVSSQVSFEAFKYCDFSLFRLMFLLPYNSFSSKFLPFTYWIGQTCNLFMLNQLHHHNAIFTLFIFSNYW